MVCKNCGKELPLAASFCWQCGTSLHAAAEQAREETAAAWETCEVMWEVVQEGKPALVGSPTHVLRFWARAFGARGTYMAGETEPFSVKKAGSTAYPIPEREAVTAHGTFIQQLMEDGWEPIREDAETWFHTHLRRRVKAPRR
jgi:hypothetical protein